MSNHLKTSAALFFSLAVFVGAACGDGGGDGSCLSICKDAQAQKCTTLKDCDLFCSAAPSLAQKSNCQSQWDAADACSKKTPACQIDATCSKERNALTACVTLYCLANATDSDCLSTQKW